MREQGLMQAIRSAVNQLPGCRVWRNNTGVAVGPDRAVRFGLGVGSADLVGLVHGRFLALEVKTATGRVTDDQERWLDTVRRFGGIAAVVRTVDDARRVVLEVARGAD